MFASNILYFLYISLPNYQMKLCTQKNEHFPEWKPHQKYLLDEKHEKNKNNKKYEKYEVPVGLFFLLSTINRHSTNSSAICETNS